MQQAAHEGDAARVGTLSGCLQTVLTDGVAANLRLAQRELPFASTRERSLHELQDRAVALVEPVEQQLSRASEPEAPQDLRLLIESLEKSRQQVLRALGP
jgi:hypothetical protein